MNKVSGIHEKKRKLLDSLNRLNKKVFSVKDAAEVMELPLAEARSSLGYFARRGWLARVKPGFYITVPLGTVNPKEYKENPWIAANVIFAPCYIGGWSAAAHWDLTDQITNSVFVFTTKIFRNKKVPVQGTDFILTLKKNLVHTKGVWIENTKIQISDPAQTIIDILDDPATGGGIRHASEILNNFFESEYAGQYQLLDYLSGCKNRTVYKRLGYILETLQIAAGDLIDRCRENISAGYSAFDPTVRSKGKLNRRWGLRVNAEIGT